MVHEEWLQKASELCKGNDTRCIDTYDMLDLEIHGRTCRACMLRAPVYGYCPLKTSLWR